MFFAGLSNTVLEKEQPQDVLVPLIAQIQLCRNSQCVAFCRSVEGSLLTVSTIQVRTAVASTGSALPVQTLESFHGWFFWPCQKLPFMVRLGLVPDKPKIQVRSPREEGKSHITLGSSTVLAEMDEIATSEMTLKVRLRLVRDSRRRGRSHFTLMPLGTTLTVHG